MRTLLIGLASLGAIAAAAYAFGPWHLHATGSPTDPRVLYYVDPMHPSYRSDKPGVAPDCGMRLEAVYREGANRANPDGAAPLVPLATVTIDGAAQRLMGIRLARVEQGGATRLLKVVGRVSPEDTRVYTVNSGVDGFIRSTYNDSVGTLVQKDQKLATYYAPDFITAASGFLAASERVPGSVSKEGARSIQNYSDRLRNLGMSNLQIKLMADTRQLPESVDVLAPATGFIVARNVSAGQHFSRDMEFYRIADLSHVWVAAEVFEEDASYLHPGAVAQISGQDGRRSWQARVTDSLPQSEAGGNTVKLRLEVDNATLTLRPEMLVNVQLPIHMPSSLTVPADALIDSGERTRVYVERAEGSFESREVRTGWRSGDRVEIRGGLRPGERVVASATFLVDSESRLRNPPGSSFSR